MFSKIEPQNSASKAARSAPKDPRRSSEDDIVELTRRSDRQVAVPERAGLVIPGFHQLAGEQLDAKVKQLAKDTGADATVDRVALAIAAVTQHKQDHMLAVLNAVGATGVGVVQTLEDMRQAGFQMRNALEQGALSAEQGRAYPNILDHEANERLDLATQFRSETTNLKLTETERRLAHQQKKHAEEIQAKIQEQINATKDSKQKNLLLILMTMSNTAQALSGGHVILTAVEMALNSGVTALAVQVAIKTISENPLLKASGKVINMLGKVSAILHGGAKKDKPKQE